MAVLTELPAWRVWRSVRAWHLWAGRCAALLLLAACLALADGVQSLMRGGADRVELLPGDEESVSGPCPFKNPVAGDVLVTFSPDGAPLSFALEEFFAGYWLGSGMWRGRVLADAAAPTGRWVMRVRFKSAVGMQDKSYTIFVFHDQAGRLAASPSFLHRFCGLPPFLAAGGCGALGFVFGLATYLLGRRAFRLLTEMGLSEIFRVSDGVPRRAWCLLTTGDRPQSGQSLPVLATDGRDLGLARAARVEGASLELNLPEGLAASCGCIVVVRGEPGSGRAEEADGRAVF